MEDPRWLRLITIGLVLAALAVGYFLLSGRLTSNSSIKGVAQTNQTNQAVPGASPDTSTTFITPTPSPQPASAYSRIASRTQGNAQSVQTLPKTGFPIGLAVIFSISGIISGWSLRKFPH